MKLFIIDEKGSTYIWAAVIILVLCMLSVVVFNVISVYTNYQNAVFELEKAVVITVNKSLRNENVRDLIFDVPQVNASSLFYENLENTGYVKDENNYVKTEDSKEKYKIENIELKFENELMEVKVEFVIPLIWQMEGITTIRIPAKILSRVYYIEY